MLFVVPVVLFDMLKAKQLACVSESGQKCPAARSLSLRRAWIEIDRSGNAEQGGRGRSPYGERGLKWFESFRSADYGSRSPYGERGLKYTDTEHGHRQGGSLSLRRAWIEIRARLPQARSSRGRSPYGERGLKLSLRRSDPPQG